MRLDKYKKQSKYTALVLWSIYLTSYVLFLKKIETTAFIDEFFVTFVSVVFVGGLWNYITKLNEISLKKYDHKHLKAAIFVLISAIGFASAIGMATIPFSYTNTVLNAWAIGLLIFYVVTMFLIPTWILSAKNT